MRMQGRVQLRFCTQSMEKSRRRVLAGRALRRGADDELRGDALRLGRAGDVLRAGAVLPAQVPESWLEYSYGPRSYGLALYCLPKALEQRPKLM